MAMEKRKQIGVKFAPDLVKRLDEYCTQFEYPPTRTDVIERAVTEFLDRAVTAKKPKR